MNVLTTSEPEQARNHYDESMQARYARSDARFGVHGATFRCEGPRYQALHRVLKTILPVALYRTWLAAIEFQQNGYLPCVQIADLAYVVGRHVRTVEIDIKKMRDRGLVTTRFIRYGDRWLMELCFDELYERAYEYLVWEHSEYYLPPHRSNLAALNADEEIWYFLGQFDNYRRLFENKKPGPKAKTQRVADQQPVPAQSDYIAPLSEEPSCEPVYPFFADEPLSSSESYGDAPVEGERGEILPVSSQDALAVSDYEEPLGQAENVKALLEHYYTTLAPPSSCEEELRDAEPIALQHATSPPESIDPPPEAQEEEAPRSNPFTINDSPYDLGRFARSAKNQVNYLETPPPIIEEEEPPDRRKQKRFSKKTHLL